MPQEIEFKLYKPNKRFRITPNLIIIFLILLLSSTIFLNEDFFGNAWKQKISATLFYSMFILGAYFQITKNFKRPPLNGDLSKKLIFTPSEIIIENQKFNLYEINEIVFYHGDYFNNLEPKRDFNPKRSNGTSNYCQLKLMNGQEIKAYFQLMYDGEFLKMKGLLTHYYTENRIPYLKLMAYLGLDNYEKIQAFKKTLPPQKN